MITDATYFVSSLTLHNALQIPFVHDEITIHANSTNYVRLTTATS
jgi:hypothetical protein